MNYLDDFTLFGNYEKASSFIDGLKKGNFLFSFVISYTKTCEIPGLTLAGENTELLKFTPPADAEYLYYGSCKTVKKIPMTPDGKPTPALLTKSALESSSIPHIVVNAGSMISPKLPYMNSEMTSGMDISKEPAMSDSQVYGAMDYGRIVGRTLASLTDCLVIGESIPGGTTTALAVLRGLGFKARVSSSMPENPVALKNRIVNTALERLSSSDPYEVVAKVGDPMLAFVTGMLSSASMTTKVMLAGGTQMAAVLGLGSKLGFNEKNTILGTTSYILDDQSANLKNLISEISDIPAIAVNPGLEYSTYSGLKAYSEGFVKEGVGAGGAIISSMIKSGYGSGYFMDIVQKEYNRVYSLDRH